MTFKKETEKNKYIYTTEQGNKIEIEISGKAATMKIDGMNSGSVSYSGDKDLKLFLKCVEEGIEKAEDSAKAYELALSINAVVADHVDEEDVSMENEIPENPKEELPPIEALEWKPTRMAKLDGVDILVDLENYTIILEETGELMANINDIGSDGMSTEEIIATLATRARIYILTHDIKKKEE